MRPEPVDQRLSILYVDDEAKARKYFAKAFEKSYRVITAESVDEAMLLLEANAGSLAVVVSDQRMPNKLGIDLVTYAKRKHPHVIRIMTTAYADLVNAIESVNEGEVYRYIRKPWDIEYLQAEVERAVRLYLQQREERQIIVEKREVMYRVASNVAHELRTPLTGVAVSVDGIGEDVEKLLRAYEQAEQANLPVPRIEKTRRNMLSRVMNAIKAHVERAHNIIDMLLISAQPLSGGKLEQLSMRDCVIQAVESYPGAESLKSCITVSISDDFTFHGVRVLAIHVIYNLIKNALYAIAGRERAGQVWIGVSTQAGTGYLHFRDNGSGISADELPFIFNEFYTTKLESSNSGVGLAFCRRTLEQWGATIECNSEVGEYTEFVLAFPASGRGEATGGLAWTGPGRQHTIG